jgi:hypothetical protein
MSISSIASQNSIPSSFSVSSSSANKNATLNQLRQQFQQLGQDLQAGSLSAAQSDFASLQQTSTNPSASANNPITQALNQLKTQLQSGQPTGTPARPAPGTPITQPTQNTGPHGHHHHHGGGESPTDPSAPPSLFDQLGQASQSNNLSAAQQAYNSLLQALPQSLADNVASTPDVFSLNA